ncbi:hypothetical protein COX86_00710 [Candidatus Micrarchaeota archaeon CG_4_10_14_0_2_um_filter_60_11]|nr:MAG: hypothetical protein AUJ16_02180 [Candidatus Micrarchaeota archaeon CG1_02_60_51]PIN96561.1 MAG: hypothetical protein COU39_00735 [Candidatus Micrarchaeota archaeon CG10_big_fil_rev_8_21_14_0_10_60_32]PIO02013.1 MAG: hypothetical protein COT58_02170 [Candidatus Micrarchaeota archaeon CG09_land_8_20_14_0_10_60_16]PIY91344.1 MAG: hypothetical protein COY71_03660 [Candidatus Micrarchaeota archaeon CG_4_10_14_0_8_um_filter_60_7]PIZ91242.1 MAG: hypothetical protein COX86_00710 [Candidatus Mi
MRSRAIAYRSKGVIASLKIPNPYAWKHFKYLIAVPIALILVSVFLWVPHIPQGIDLKGGLLLTVYTSQPVSAPVVKDALVGYADVEVRAFDNAFGSGFEVELPVNDELQQAEVALAQLHDLETNLTRAEISNSYYQNSDNVTAAERAEAQANVTGLTAAVLDNARFVAEKCGAPLAASEAHAAVAEVGTTFDQAKSDYRQNLISAVSGTVTVNSYSFKEIGASLSQVFFSKVRDVLLYSFILATIVVFFIFRSFVPSAAVVFGAIADISITAGLMGVFQIPLTLASIAALLMLIGFSLDTDALLTVRVLKRNEGIAKERAYDAMFTGATMNAAVMTSFGVLAIIAYYLQIPTYMQIGQVAFLGGAVDFIATWCFNAVIVLWAAERRGLP